MKSLLSNQSSSKKSGMLAESALLLMAANEYMNAKQLAFFKHKLLETQVRLTEATSLKKDNAINGCEIESDPVDRASNEEVRNNEQLVRANDLRMLSDVIRALKRIQDGDYGYCDQSGEEIGIPRLLARPTANLTVEEQSRFEKRFVITG